MGTSRAAVFTDDSIRRDDLPRDVFELLHDICYHHDGRDVGDYVRRAQAALSVAPPETESHHG